MSEPKQPPKLLQHKPKKSQRSASDTSSKGDGTGGARSVSTASSSSTPPSSELKRSLWHRFRVPITTLLVLNAVVVGYTLFRTTTTPSEISEEAQSVENKPTEKETDEKKPKEETQTQRTQDEKKPLVETVQTVTEKENDEKKPIKAEIEKEKAEDVHTKGGLPELPKVPQAIGLQEISKQKISSEEQQELFKWLLEEKRKVKPANKAERAQIDAEKALLKDFLKGKSIFNV